MPDSHPRDEGHGRTRGTTLGSQRPRDSRLANWYAEEGLPDQFCPVTGATGVVYLRGGPRVRDAARRSSRNGSGAVSQQHGSLEHEWAFLPVLVIALVMSSHDDLHRAKPYSADIAGICLGGGMDQG